MTIDHRETTRFERYATLAAVVGTGLTSAAIANEITVSGATTGNGTFSGRQDWSLLVTGNGGSVTLRGNAYADEFSTAPFDRDMAGGYLNSGSDHRFLGKADQYSRAIAYGFVSSTLANFGTLSSLGSAVGFLGFKMRATITQSAGEWVGTGGQAVTRFLGFKVGDGSDVRYGWAEILLDLDLDGTSRLTFIDSYLGAAGDTTIVAGQTAPSNAVPGLGGLAALACGAAGLRNGRRRSA